jgi:hypothetical protein
VKKAKTAVPFPGLPDLGDKPAPGIRLKWTPRERIAQALDLIADAVLAYRAAARTKKAKKRQRARRKAQRESSI